MNRIFFVLGILGIISCSSGDKRFKVKPLAFSKTNEISVVMDKELWEGAVGDSLRFYLNSPYLILPAPEAIFDLRYFEPYQIKEEEIFRTLRNYIFVANLNDKNSPTTGLIKGDLGKKKVNATLSGKRINLSLGKDKWANGQNIFYLYSNSADGIFETIRKSYPSIVKQVHTIEAPRIEATAYQGGENIDIEEKIKEKFGVKMKIPKGYVVALSEDNMMWLRRETKGVSSSILMTKVKYKGKEQLTQPGIRSIRDTMGLWVSSNQPNSYIRTNDVDLPMFCESNERGDSYVVTCHGIWEMENDFKGGPFITTALVDEQKGELFVADGFIFAPGEKLRNHMQYLDAIMKTVKKATE